MTHTQNLNAETVKILKRTFENKHCLRNQFKKLASLPDEHARLEITPTITNRIAAIRVHDPNTETLERAVVCWNSTENEPTFIKTHSPSYMPLQYVLMFHTGTPGWSLKYRRTNAIKQQQYYRELVLRYEALNLLGLLLNEFLCDAISAILEERHSYLRNTQLKCIQKKDLVSAIAITVITVQKHNRSSKFGTTDIESQGSKDLSRRILLPTLPTTKRGKS